MLPFEYPEKLKSDARLLIPILATSDVNNPANNTNQAISTTRIRNDTQGHFHIRENTPAATTSTKIQRSSGSPDTTTIIALTSSDKDTDNTGENHHDGEQPNQHQEDILDQKYPKPRFKLGAEITNTFGAENLLREERKLPPTGTNTPIGTDPSTDMSNVVQTERPSTNNNNWNYHTNHRLSRYIQRQDSTISPPRPPKMKTSPHDNNNAHIGARTTLEAKELPSKTPTATVHPGHHNLAAEGFRETTGVVIFKPRPQSASATTVADENNNLMRACRTTKPTPQQSTIIPSIYPITRKKCRGTIYRLAQVGRSDHPGHQAGPCYTHL